MPTKALVVEDEPVMGELLQAILESAGMRAEVLTSSSVAAARLQMEKFDVVFLDLHMPPPDGLELTRLVRVSGFNQKTPIVMITGDQTPGALAKGFAAGATFFLFKPIEAPRLMRVVRAAEAAIQRERRRFQRVAVRCPVELTDGRDRISGTSIDISLGGVLVQADRYFPVNTRVEMALKIAAGTPPLRTQAQVMRVLEDGCMGIELQISQSGVAASLQQFLLPLILDSGAANATAAKAHGGIAPKVVRRSR